MNVTRAETLSSKCSLLGRWQCSGWEWVVVLCCYSHVCLVCLRQQAATGPAPLSFGWWITWPSNTATPRASPATPRTQSLWVLLWFFTFSDDPLVDAGWLGCVGGGGGGGEQMLMGVAPELFVWAVWCHQPATHREPSNGGCHFLCDEVLMVTGDGCTLVILFSFWIMCSNCYSPGRFCLERLGYISLPPCFAAHWGWMWREPGIGWTEISMFLTQLLKQSKQESSATIKDKWQKPSSFENIQ